MAKRISRSNPKPKRPKIFLKQWRLHRGLTQDRLAGLVELETSSISQLETGKQGYSDETLAALANALNCEPGDILSRDPNAPDYQLWRIINGMPAEKQAQALRLIKALDEKAA